MDIIRADGVSILRAAVFDPHAHRTYDALSDSFWWSDETWPEFIQSCRTNRSWALRYLLGYRGTLIRGQPDDTLWPFWDQIARQCPNWPGLTGERCSATLLPALESASRRARASFERTEKNVFLDSGGENK